ncbi:MAG: NAD(P)/FAD-dependent oxidoreductase [Moraxellaceae bacterium]|nr:MAG: NAD(P)/FAD-dependent oxidoreductase [Moraxellaceae bacterium]
MSVLQTDVIVIGAGASGLMCAAIAAQRGRRVLVLERANKVGKKILMSGGGRCNFTNLYVEPENFLSHNPHFVISALSRYTQWDFLGLVADYKIAYEERKHGQLFCQNSAKDILNMLLAECSKTGKVTIQTSTEIESVQISTSASKSSQFILNTNLGVYQCESLVVASGGLSIPTLGGSGFGYELARQFGHHVYPTRAGLVPFTFSNQFKAVTERLSGNALDVTLSNTDAEFTEALLFTHRGLSGPSSLQLSNYWQVGSPISINFFPALDIAQWLMDKKQAQPKSLLRTVLSEIMAKSIVLELQQLIWPQHSETALGQLSDTILQDIAKQLQQFEQKPSGTEGYRTAEVTLGGVDTTELSSKTMESKKQQGLYFIGEVMDVTGHLGGFNFQWAWASGAAAGQVV